MEKLGIEEARGQLGEIADRARLTLQPTMITKNGKPAAVVVSHEWLTEVAALLDDLAEDPAAYAAWRGQAGALRQARLTTELAAAERRR